MNEKQDWSGETHKIRVHYTYPANSFYNEYFFNRLFVNFHSFPLACQAVILGSMETLTTPPPIFSDITITFLSTRLE